MRKVSSLDLLLLLFLVREGLEKADFMAEEAMFTAEIIASSSEESEEESEDDSLDFGEGEKLFCLFFVGVGGFDFGFSLDLGVAFALPMDALDALDDVLLRLLVSLAISEISLSFLLLLRRHGVRALEGSALVLRVPGIVF